MRPLGQIKAQKAQKSSKYAPWYYRYREASFLDIDIEIFDIFNILVSIYEISYIDNEEDEDRWFDHDKETFKITRVKIAKIERKRYDITKEQNIEETKLVSWV